MPSFTGSSALSDDYDESDEELLQLTTIDKDESMFLYSDCKDYIPEELQKIGYTVENISCESTPVWKYLGNKSMNRKCLMLETFCQKYEQISNDNEEPLDFSDIEKPFFVERMKNKGERIIDMGISLMSEDEVQVLNLLARDVVQKSVHKNAVVGCAEESTEVIPKVYNDQVSPVSPSESIDSSEQNVSVSTVPDLNARGRRKSEYSGEYQRNSFDDKKAASTCSPRKSLNVNSTCIKKEKPSDMIIDCSKPGSSIVKNRGRKKHKYKHRESHVKDEKVNATPVKQNIQILQTRNTKDVRVLISNEDKLICKNHLPRNAYCDKSAAEDKMEFKAQERTSSIIECEVDINTLVQPHRKSRNYSESFETGNAETFCDNFIEITELQDAAKSPVYGKHVSSSEENIKNYQLPRSSRLTCSSEVPLRHRRKLRSSSNPTSLFSDYSRQPHELNLSHTSKRNTSRQEEPSIKSTRNHTNGGKRKGDEIGVHELENTDQVSRTLIFLKSNRSSMNSNLLELKSGTPQIPDGYPDKPVTDFCTTDSSKQFTDKCGSEHKLRKTVSDTFSPMALRFQNAPWTKNPNYREVPLK